MGFGWRTANEAQFKVKRPKRTLNNEIVKVVTEIFELLQDVRSVDPVLPFGSYIRYLLMKDSTVLSDLFGIIVLERCRLLLMKIWNINISVHGKCIVRHAWK
ncbi:hypothetical protein L1887_11458 [Cichorium endivia]|nr:hypothetical protein L1887_11458 [Cichorium endivia]